MSGNQFDNGAYDADREGRHELRAVSLATAREERYGENVPDEGDL